MDRRRWGWVLGLGLGVAIAPGIRVHAQIVPDGSLGSEGSVTTPMETGVQIDGGALRGDNLFHSFQEFSVPTNSEAFFNNPDVANIFSRVTGGSISDIDGLLRANGTANLFLLNPNGIVFGPNARLDIGGSFVASTANSLVFENGLEFSASDAGDTAPLLSVNVPLGVQFNGNPGSLEATGATLNVSEGGAIALVGGEISLDDVEMNAPAGRIDLVGVGEAGQVRFEVGDADSGFPSGGFGVPADLSRASVSLDGTTLNVAGLVGGEIGIQALDVEMRDSVLLGGIAEGLGIEGGQSGNIELDATGNITISNGAIANSVREGSIGNAGDINLSADNIELNNGAQLSSSTFGEGDAGSVTLRASNSITLSGSNSEDFPSAIFNQVRESGQGNAGNVSLSGEVIEISEGALFSSSTFGEGDAGNITIEASDTARFSDSNVFSTVEETGRGNAGNIRVIGDRVEVRDGAQLISSTLGQGNAGRINIEGAEAIIFSGEDSESFPSAAFSTVGATGRGNAGEVNLQGNYVEVSDGAELSSSTLGEGDAGNVTIEAGDTARVLNGDVLSTVEESGLGNAGNIRVTGDRVEVLEGAQLISNTLGQGDAGRISIQGAEAIIFSGENSEGSPSGAFSRIRETGQGDAGEINLLSNYIEVSDGAQLSSSTFGEGDAGNITIEASDTARFSNANVFSSVGESGLGNAGNIRVTGDRVEVQDGAQLSSSTSGQGDAGRINIQGAEAIIFSGEDSESFPSAAFSSVRGMGRGNAGEVNLQGNYVEVSNGAELSSSTFGEGDAGNVTIEASDTARFLNGDVFSSVGESGLGNAGNIRVTGDRVEVQDGAQLISDTSGQGDAGRINIQGAEAIIFSGENAEGLVSGAFSRIREAGQGDAGEINLRANQVEVSNGAELSSSTFGEGDAGNVTIEASDTARFVSGNVFSTVEETGRGNAGNIRVIGDRVEVRDGAQLISSTLGQGNAGRINIEGAEAIIFSGEDSESFPSAAFSTVGATGRGNAGEVNLQGDYVEVSNGAELSSSTFGEGDAGNVTIEAGDTARVLNGDVLSTVEESGQGNGGDIRIIADMLFMEDGARLNSSTLGQGNAGTVTIQASGEVLFSNSFAASIVGENVRGNSGGVDIISDRLEVRDGAAFISSSFGQGNAGHIRVEASESIMLSNSFILSTIQENGQGNAGDINIISNTLEMRDESQLNSSTLGEGNAGTIRVEARDTISFSGLSSRESPIGIFSLVEETGRGNAGGVSIRANTVEVNDGAQLSSSTFGRGNAGTVTIEANDRVILSGLNNPEGLATGAFSAVGDTGQGNAGDVRILANSLEMRDGAQLNSVTFGQGDAGTIRVEASDRVVFSGVNPRGEPSLGLTSVLQTGQGDAGGISILANTLELRDGAALDSSTLGQGNAGTISIDVSETFLLSNGFVASGVGEEGRGNAGDVNVVANRLEVHDGLLLSSSLNQGDAGTVTVEVQDTAIFSGFYTHPSGSAPSGWRSGLYSTVEETGQGNAGGVNLIAGTVELRDGTRLSSSNNTTSNANDFTAGDVFVQADRLHLSDRADISANTGGRGGNVRLNTGTTILRRGSTIQTNAEGDFPGGNIIIDTDALVALENSDITANALNAAGGRVIINSQGIFGTEFRDELTPQSDITATSDLGAEFSGSVELNTPEVDTATGLVDLSANPIDVAALLDTDPCTLGRESEFYVTGRGGLPPNPDGSLATETTWVDWRSLEDNSSETAMARDEETAPLVEAQGWHVNGEGAVVLSAQTPDGSATPPQRIPAHCSPLTPTP